MKITTIGIDLAKNVFQIHGVDAHGKTVIKKQLKRDQVAPFFANLPACLIGMEACGSAHHWGRKLQAMGHTVKLMEPQYVKCSRCIGHAKALSKPARRKPTRYGGSWPSLA